MVVVLVETMNAGTPSAAARVRVVVDTLAFINHIVADGIKTMQFGNLIASRRPCMADKAGKQKKTACEDGFYSAIEAAAQ
jgi:hypothetical protein